MALMAKQYKPRITVEVTPEQYEALKKHLPHGLMRKIFSVFIEDAMRMYDTYGEHFTVAMLQKKISYDSMMRRYAERNMEEFEFGDPNER
jgi:hypothetical protein